MKKLNLKMKGIGEILSKEQMKNVVGGDYGEGGKYQCCPSAGNGTIGCSECVTVPPGSTATCTLGTLTPC